MEKYILIGIGVLNIGITSMLLFKKDFAESYVATSPKAYIWRKLFGEEKAIMIIKNIFSPIGLLIGITLIIFGIVL
jgi:hypothetical protein